MKKKGKKKHNAAAREKVYAVVLNLSPIRSHGYMYLGWFARSILLCAKPLISSSLPLAAPVRHAPSTSQHTAGKVARR